MPNHRKTSTKKVPNGTAPEDFWPQMSVFRKQKMAKMMPGKKKAVLSVLVFQSEPLNILKRRDEKYPAKRPMMQKRRSIAVMRPPRLAGERKPSTAKPSVMTVIPRSCTPVPTHTERSEKFSGARKTSPCTSFHPVSSCASSAVSSWLYLEMSRWSVRNMMSATIPLKKSTIMSELTMLNQWIWSSVMSKYVSQRLAQRMSDILKKMSYEKMISSPSSTICGAKPCVTCCMCVGLHVSSVGFTASHGASYSCLTEKGSTSKPTMRERSVSMSL
mmetsp:Transcript_27831/g.91095  ORF Transcript_27831/g.91095 Transcript_27831/m.91095 type:complete len:273 (-) Transcript_27831:677-1495(-)